MTDMRRAISVTVWCEKCSQPWQRGDEMVLVLARDMEDCRGIGLARRFPSKATESVAVIDCETPTSWMARPAKSTDDPLHTITLAEVGEQFRASQDYLAGIFHAECAPACGYEVPLDRLSEMDWVLHVGRKLWALGRQIAILWQLQREFLRYEDSVKSTGVGPYAA